MTPERWQQIAEIFDRVVDRPAAERAACLAQICGDDQELRREVESLLAHEFHETFIKDPIRHAAQVVTQSSADDMLGRRLGPYRVMSLIGHGGMGAVYRAVRDDDQYQQQVALKLVKRGMDTDFVLNRFRYERQILASLEHAHIARLLDGGSTQDGLPYLVMEYIEGEAITSYCETHKLSITERLKLFLQVCAAVGYAHQKLVVHRDLKPSNIMVTKEGELKLLDFGIAKLLAPDLAPEAVPRTLTELRLMTPDYASPEQVRGLPITTATDIYSLGAVLYELLTGERPHRFKNYSSSEIERAICQTETEKPSAAVNRTTTAPAKQRKQQGKQLSGDLDNIVLMAMRKEPERRYSSVEQFAEDLRRHLEGRPVIARQDTFGYRASKFVQRHKLGLAAAALVSLSLVGGIVVARYQARRAERRFQQVRKLANTFLFDFHDKIQDLKGSTDARELLVNTALEYLDSLAQEAASDPSLERELAVAYRKVGDVQGDPFLNNLGHPEAAMQSYLKSVSLSQKLVAQDPNNIAMRDVLADGSFKLGVLQSESGDKAHGLTTLRQALSVAEALAQQTNDQKVMTTVENCYDRIGDIQLDTGDPASALQTYRHTQEITTRRAAAHPSDKAQYGVAACYSHIGETLAAMGDLTNALENFRQNQQLIAALDRQHPTSSFYRRQLLVAFQWLGNLSGAPTSINLGDTATAIQYHQQALSLAEELAAADPKDAAAQMDLANSYSSLGSLVAESAPAQGAEWHRKAVAITRALLEVSQHNFRFQRRHANHLRRLATSLRLLGDHQGALQNVRQSLEIIESQVAKKPANADLQNDLRATLTTLAEIQLAAGDLPAALASYRRVLALAETSSAARPGDMYAQWRLADAYANLGLYHAALAAASTSPLTERIANWREARAWRQKSLAVWDAWSQHGVSSVFNLTKHEQAARALVQCEAALAKLETTPAR